MSAFAAAIEALFADGTCFAARVAWTWKTTVSSITATLCPISRSGTHIPLLMGTIIGNRLQYLQKT